MFCPDCGKEIKDGARFCGECGKKVAADQPETAGQHAVTKNPAPCKAGRGNKLLAAIAIAVVALLVIGNRRDDRKVVYELIPEIFEAEDIALGYGKAVFPKYGSDKIEIVALGYTENHDGDTFEMYQVNGSVGITSAFGTEHDIPYQMKVGIDKDFNDTGRYYYILEEGLLFW